MLSFVHNSSLAYCITLTVELSEIQSTKLYNSAKVSNMVVVKAELQKWGKNMAGFCSGEGGYFLWPCKSKTPSLTAEALPSNVKSVHYAETKTWIGGITFNYIRIWSLSVRGKFWIKLKIYNRAPGIWFDTLRVL